MSGKGYTRYRRLRGIRPAARPHLAGSMYYYDTNTNNAEQLCTTTVVVVLLQVRSAPTTRRLFYTPVMNSSARKGSVRHDRPTSTLRVATSGEEGMHTLSGSAKRHAGSPEEGVRGNGGGAGSGRKEIKEKEALVEGVRGGVGGATRL